MLWVHAFKGSEYLLAHSHAVWFLICCRRCRCLFCGNFSSFQYQNKECLVLWHYLHTFRCVCLCVRVKHFDIHSRKVKYFGCGECCYYQPEYIHLLAEISNGEKENQHNIQKTATTNNNDDDDDKRVQIVLQRNPHIDTPITKVKRTNEIPYESVCAGVCVW